MTNPDRIREERRVDDERVVDTLLAEAGFGDDAGLRAVLLGLRELRVDEVPEPSREVAALMGEGGAAKVIRLKDAAASRKAVGRKHRRAALTTLAVAASLGIAGGAAAANENFRNQAAGTLGSFLHSFAPSSPTPSPIAPSTPAATSPAAVPSADGKDPSVPIPAPPYPITIPPDPDSKGSTNPRVDQRSDGGEATLAPEPKLPPRDASSDEGSTRDQATEPEEARATPPRQSPPPADGSVPGNSSGKPRDNGGTSGVGTSDGGGASPAPAHGSRK